MKDFKTFINENILVPRNLEGRKDKLKQINIKLLSHEVIDEDLDLDESFMDIDPKLVKLKKVNGNVSLNGQKWTEIPEWLKDVEITGIFNCTFNKLTTLKNCPQKIGADFDCSYNHLTSMKYSPKKVGESFLCDHNLLTSLEGCPETIKGHFACSYNQLISLKGCPKNIILDFSCSHNQLRSLEGCPENVGDYFYCFNNAIKLEIPSYVKLKGEFVNS